MDGVSFTDRTEEYNKSAHTLAIAGNLPAGVDKVTYTYNSKTHDPPFSFTEAGRYTVTANFVTGENYNIVTSKTATLVIERTTKLAISNAPTAVRYGESVDYSGMTITATKTDGTNETPYTVGINDVTMSQVNTSSIGTQTVTVTYKDATATFSITVENYIKSITAEYTGTEVYTNGSQVDTSKISVTARYANNSTAPLTTGVTFSNTTVNTANEVHYVTVSYPGVDNVTVRVNVRSANISYTSSTASGTLGGQEFGEAITVTWDTNETATIRNSTTGETATANSGVSLTTRGKYTLTIGSKSVDFELYWDSEEYLYARSGNVLTFSHVDKIGSVVLYDWNTDTETTIGLPAEGDFTYTLQPGDYDITIMTKKGIPYTDAVVVE